MKDLHPVIERLVKAHDGLGGLLPTPENQVVKIPRIRDGINMEGGAFTPRLARAFFCERIDQAPHRLISIERRGERLRVEIEFKHPSKRSLSGSRRRALAVLTDNDARDPYFGSLSTDERARIVSAFHSIPAGVEART